MQKVLLSLFKLHLVATIGKRENAQLAVRPGRALRDDVRQQDGQSSVVVQPPHVDRTSLLRNRRVFIFCPYV